jgi:hypothetical protein
MRIAGRCRAAVNVRMRDMKKNIIVFLLVFLLVSMVILPAYAVNIVDTFLCKRAVLRANNMSILVNRVTGNVKYALLGDRWIPVKGALKVRCQTLYNLQKQSARPNKFSSRKLRWNKNAPAGLYKN